MLAICVVCAYMHSSPGFPRWKHRSTYCTHTKVAIVRHDLTPCLHFSAHGQSTKSGFIHMDASTHPNREQNVYFNIAITSYLPHGNILSAKKFIGSEKRVKKKSQLFKAKNVNEVVLNLIFVRFILKKYLFDLEFSFQGTTHICCFHHGK